MGTKPFQTYEQLLDKLIVEKHLIIPHREEAIGLLKRHSYFSLISGYKKLFKDGTGCYRTGVTLYDLLALFEFDNTLRSIFLNALLSVEKHIKSLVSYAFVAKYGDPQSAYLDPRNYRMDNAIQIAQVTKLAGTLQEIVTPPFQQPYIQHQHKHHGNIPLWVAVKALTMGNISKMYSLCTQDVQVEVSREFPGVAEHQLPGMLDYLTKLRNVCAHSERVYDFSPGSRRIIPAMPLHKALGIPQKSGTYHHGQKDLFAALICFKYLLLPQDFNLLVADIQSALTTLHQQTKQIPPNQILSEMGFPHHWAHIATL